jgi:hypothetical protein
LRLALGGIALFVSWAPGLANAQPAPPAEDAEISAAPSPAPQPSAQPAAIPEPPPAAPVAAPPAPAPTAAPVPPPAPAAPPQKSDEVELPVGIQLSGYLQGQYESHQDSEGQLRQDGTLFNQDRFLVRRARMRFRRDWDYASAFIEFDGNTMRGPAFRLWHAEASLVYGRSPEKGVPPIAQLTFGLFDLPFGFELVESPMLRWFMERSVASRALFPSEPDLGARLSGGIKFFRYALAFTNGEPADEKTGYPLQDPSPPKDFTIRVGVDTKPTPVTAVAGGVSYYRGQGFHAGTLATKNSLGWKDLNQNGNVDPNEVVGLPGVAATPSQRFRRWALGADLRLGLRTPIGWSTVFGELVIATNLDRGLFVADPISSQGDVRELGYMLGLSQEVTPYAVVGFRTDYYDPNADLFEKRAGKLLPLSQRIRVFSPLVGLVLPDRARLLFQYDIQDNLLARDSRGVPTRLPNNQLTLRLQVIL